MNYRRISVADCNIACPGSHPTHFTAKRSAALRSACLCSRTARRPVLTSKKGASFGLGRAAWVVGQKLVPGQNLAVDQDGGGEDGPLRGRQEGYRRRRYPPAHQEMGATGVDAEVILGFWRRHGLNARGGHRDVQHLQRLVADFANTIPTARSAFSMPAIGDIDAAVREIHPRGQARACAASRCSCSWDMERVSHDVGAVLQAVNEVRLPMHFHKFPR